MLLRLGSVWNGSQRNGLQTHLRSISAGLRNLFGVVEVHQGRHQAAGTAMRILWHGCKGKMVGHLVRIRLIIYSGVYCAPQAGVVNWKR